MNGILVISETRNGEVTTSSLELISAAIEVKNKTSQPIMVASFSNKTEHSSEQVDKEGVDEVISVEMPHAHFDVDAYEAAIGAVIEERNPNVILAPHSVDAWGYAPVAAVNSGYNFVTDVIALNYDGNEFIATRTAYSEKTYIDLSFANSDKIFATVRGGVFAPKEGKGNAKQSSIPLPQFVRRSKHMEFIAPDFEDSDVDISRSRYILAIGRGCGTKEDIGIFEDLADSMGFTLACSRPITDHNWLPKSKQVGQSGKTVSNCEIYLCFGISGAVQHLTGMSHVPNIIAVNNDPESGIFSVAHLGVVGDLYEISEELRQHFD